ncbi:methylenetetrahydrofolate reductase-domain-containing protein [Zopfochytrium polystomum]|nr:methylenetetrahydrofolate reductase-domain-containing protein [Zopfochytrium polystomum]
MKITKKIQRALDEGRCFWSFEYFPPKTDIGVCNLYDRMERMYMLGPEFIDVTWGAGGSSAELTLQICTTAQAVYGLETCMHLTCTNMPREKVDEALNGAKAAGIQNILALRGDPPRGQINWTKVDSGFSNAIDLVKYIREQYGDYFCIGVAGYPEGHAENNDFGQDFKYFVEKTKIADYVVTQLFYDVDLYLKWVEQVREAGVTCPILPGIMPIQSYGGFKRMTTLCKTKVPAFILKELEPIKDDDKAVKEYGVSLAMSMCNKIKAAGGLGFHFCCLNLEKSVRLILEGLEFVAPIEVAKPLPWSPSLARNREKETVRPIFWKNRTRSYILRTESWDDFPNGRWGDSRSPAYGDIGCYGVSLKYTEEEALAMWGSPITVADICNVFVSFCKNELSGLPWCDQPLTSETTNIRNQLISINDRGFLTINSQPAVDGALSSHPVYGWGPKNGVVYQKSYLEFFVSPAELDTLIRKISDAPTVTFHAVSKDGDLKTNTQSDGPNAVTWGVFPGQEIVQPTVVDPVSFMAWKDKAFDLWNKWASIYKDDSPTAKLIRKLTDTWFLVNIVENDYRNGNIFSLF